MKRITLSALCAFALLALPAQAGKPHPTVTISPNPVLPYDVFSVSGCGYPKSVLLSVESEASFRSYDVYFKTPTDSSGCFRFPAQAYDSGSTQTFSLSHGAKFLASGTEVTA